MVGFRPRAGDNIGMELAAKAPAGGYTLQIAGKNGAEGVILLELYEVP